MTKSVVSRLKTGVALAAIAAQLAVTPANAFCGFYVAQANAKLFNKSSKVVLARNGQQTAITMASDYEGEPKDFAIVIPVPSFIKKDQISAVDPKMIDHLDAYTAPRLVEYFDEDPCAPPVMAKTVAATSMAGIPVPVSTLSSAHVVRVEAQYDVAEYDVSILSADDSNGLIQWLTENGYRIPAGAEPVIGSYIKQKMHFFVAKVNLDRMKAIGNGYLQPLQVRYETPKFMLPLRLGTVNANGPQDLIVYALTQRGRIEATNYRTTKVPSDLEVPLYVKDDFAAFYKATFERAVARQDSSGVFVEYAWDMSWCDPCAAERMSNVELTTLGAGWSVTGEESPYAGANAFVTRLHVRYDASSFPEDLNFVETGDRQNFQGRYILQHPSTAPAKCEAGAKYRADLPKRFRQEADNLVYLTGWSAPEVAARMATTGQPFTSSAR
jgi:hypothetical protein